MIEKYLDLEGQRIIVIEIFEGKDRNIYERNGKNISDGEYKEINGNFPKVQTLPFILHEKNGIKIPLPEEKDWDFEKVKKYLTENEIYIRFILFEEIPGIELTPIEKIELFISSVEKETDNKFILNIRGLIEGEIVNLRNYSLQRKINPIELVVLSKK